jgi:hypothetical protein
LSANNHDGGAGAAISIITSRSLGPSAPSYL